MAAAARKQRKPARIKSMADLTEEELQALYCWIDEIPLSRPKRSITRDFSDGVLTAEIVHHFLPHLVEIHNYSPANSSTQKVENWRTLNRKVFPKLNFSIPNDIIQSVSASKPGVAEFILTTLRTKIERYLQNKAKLKEHQLNAGYPYDPNELSTSEMSTMFGQFNPVAPANPPQGMRLAIAETSYDQSQTNDTHLPAQPQFEYPHTHLPHLRPPPVTFNPQNPAPPLPSRLRPPAHYHHSTQSQSSTLPPIHLHTNNTAAMVTDDEGRDGAVAQTIPKLPNIHGRSKTYAGRPNRIGGPSTNVPSVALTGPKRQDSAKQQIRLAEKEQKLYETQEYIQLLQMKVTRLQHLVHIKDMKIDELHRHLAAVHSRYPLHKR